MEKVKRVLITGISGFIGKHTAQLLMQKKYEVTAMVRPGTNKERIKQFIDVFEFVEIDLTDIDGLKKYLEANSFDVIVHIGAVRGGRKFSRQVYYDANVNATEQFILNAYNNESKFIFCSSVGVFGAIPIELPANNQTERQEDNYYHFTKIKSEALIQKYVLEGLNAAIVRPAITYGVGDYGFPYTLVKLVDKKMLFLPNNIVKIHMSNVNLMAESFVKLIDSDFVSGSAYNVADKAPVDLLELADHINDKLHGRPYPRNRIINKKFFRLGEKIAKLLKNELWTARFELISKSWYYDTENTYKDLSLKTYKTMNEFKTVIDWYKTEK